MKRIIAGGTGLIGTALVEHWLKANHKILVIGRSAGKINHHFQKQVQACTWAELSAKHLTGAEVIVNLTGANIASKRWTASRKEEILHSRVQSTERLAKLCSELGKDSPMLLNASAVGAYPFGSQMQTEDDKLPSPHNFLMQIASQWEHATDIAKSHGVRVINLRFGVVLSKKGGALPQMSLPFRFYMGGPIDTGEQYISWVALPEICSIIDFLIKNKTLQGPVNLVAPNVVKQHEFAKLLGQSLKKPSLVRFPGFLVKLLFGEMGEELLLSGQWVYPKRLLEAGYTFKYPTLEITLDEL